MSQCSVYYHCDMSQQCNIYPYHSVCLHVFLHYDSVDFRIHCSSSILWRHSCINEGCINATVTSCIAACVISCIAACVISCIAACDISRIAACVISCVSDASLLYGVHVHLRLCTMTSTCHKVSITMICKM